MGRPEDCKAFGERLAWALEHAGKDAPALWKHLAVSRAAVNVYLKNPKGKRVMKAHHCARTAIFLGVDTDWLAAGLGLWKRNHAWLEDTIQIAAKFEAVAPEQRAKALGVLGVFANDGASEPDSDSGKADARVRVAFAESHERQAQRKFATKATKSKPIKPMTLFKNPPDEGETKR